MDFPQERVSLVSLLMPYEYLLSLPQEPLLPVIHQDYFSGLVNVCTNSTKCQHEAGIFFSKVELQVEGEVRGERT